MVRIFLGLDTEDIEEKKTLPRE